MHSYAQHLKFYVELWCKFIRYTQKSNKYYNNQNEPKQSVHRKKDLFVVDFNHKNPQRKFII